MFRPFRDSEQTNIPSYNSSTGHLCRPFNHKILGVALPRLRFCSIRNDKSVLNLSAKPGISVYSKSLKFIALAAAVFCLVGGVAFAKASIPDFVELAKKNKPTVVNISTAKVIKSQAPYHRSPRSPSGSDPFEEFFGRFFDNMPKQPYTARSLGSGFIISSDGYILTNYHVVAGADEIKVKLSDAREFKGVVKGWDEKLDLALVKIDAKDHLPVAVLGDSDTTEVGEWVMAIGNPFGLGQTVTAGIVSAKERVIGSGPYDDFIQTDASINPGEFRRPADQCPQRGNWN